MMSSQSDQAEQAIERSESSVLLSLIDDFTPSWCPYLFPVKTAQHMDVERWDQRCPVFIWFVKGSKQQAFLIQVLHQEV